MKTLLYLVTAVLNVGLTLTLQLWDRRRLTPAQRAGAWNAASWGAALGWAFFLGGAASILPWVWVTRSDWPTWRKRGLGPALGWSALTLLAGLVATALVYAVILAAALGLQAALGVKDPD